MTLPRKTRPGPWALSCLAAASLAACGGSSDDAATVVTPAAVPIACEQLVGLSLPAASIGLPTMGGTVTSAVVVARSGTGVASVPEHCLVNARLGTGQASAPPILMRVALPAEWNTKTVMYGGGGFNGSIPNVVGNVPAAPSAQPAPLARGYAVFASDSGHQAGALASQDGQWGLNDEAVRNFGGDVLKKVRDAALIVIKARYAANAPTKSYFIGGSTGGREALTAIQRWPADWDAATVPEHCLVNARHLTGRPFGAQDPDAGRVAGRAGTPRR